MAHLAHGTYALRGVYGGDPVLPDWVAIPFFALLIGYCAWRYWRRRK
ncbi:hypothetical protein OG746_05655 [Streptomyces sp. NBC_01016]|nr:hypothetical protein [Streptomyces sp. NBC_01016]MCX4828219.1 hypothetical protein [Streptomyces sp. NBC_01016]